MNVKIKNFKVGADAIGSKGGNPFNVAGRLVQAMVGKGMTYDDAHNALNPGNEL
jgi:hypothetical protein